MNFNTDSSDASGLLSEILIHGASLFLLIVRLLLPYTLSLKLSDEACRLILYSYILPNIVACRCSVLLLEFKTLGFLSAEVAFIQKSVRRRETRRHGKKIVGFQLFLLDKIAPAI